MEFIAAKKEVYHVYHTTRKLAPACWADSPGPKGEDLY